MLREQSDVRSVAFMLIAIALIFILWNYSSEMSWWLLVPLYIFQLQMAVSISVMCHNHKHVGMWKNKTMNIITDNVLSVLYGFPIFAWLPTHMSNHHVNVNTEADYTKTYRYSEKNNIFTLLAYPMVSGYYQQGPVASYFVSSWKESKKIFFLNLLQIILIVGVLAIAFYLDWRKALLFVFIPQQISLNTVLIFNYIQHIHADEETQYNNSRNVTGGMVNFWLLNNGFHTVHHLWPSMHWSKAAEKHREIEHKIDPSLNESNFAWYLFRVYILGLFNEKFRTKSMRVQRIEHPESYVQLP